MSEPAPGEPVRVLFVCLGNICRSPTAEGVMRALVSSEGLEGRIVVESAGTGGWHVGSPPDARAAAAARARGVALDGTARQVRAEDFEDFDYLVAMDGENLRALRSLAPGEQERAKVRLLREFDPASGGSSGAAGAGDLDVPDPYYGGEDGFGEVFELVRAACAGPLDQLRDGSAGLGS
jgi:low molecular weight protein-tyrosine phosphatase